MAKFVTSEPFAGLAKQIKAIKVDRLVDNAMAEAADEYVQELRALHHHAGADEPLVNAIHSFKAGTVRAVGVPDNTPEAQNAFEFEFGKDDHSSPPHGLFRLEEPGMAKHAAENVGVMLSNELARGGPAGPNPSPMSIAMGDA